MPLETTSEEATVEDTRKWTDRLDSHGLDRLDLWDLSPLRGAPHSFIRGQHGLLSGGAGITAEAEPAAVVFGGEESVRSEVETAADLAGEERAQRSPGGSVPETQGFVLCGGGKGAAVRRKGERSDFRQMAAQGGDDADGGGFANGDDGVFSAAGQPVAVRGKDDRADGAGGEDFAPEPASGSDVGDGGGAGVFAGSEIASVGREGEAQQSHVIRGRCAFNVCVREAWSISQFGGRMVVVIRGRCAFNVCVREAWSISQFGGRMVVLPVPS